MQVFILSLNLQSVSSCRFEVVCAKEERLRLEEEKLRKEETRLQKREGLAGKMARTFSFGVHAHTLLLKRLNMI
jgi:hypothetical protein